MLRESEVRNKEIDNKCSRCGECCGLFIPLTKKEVRQIKSYVKCYKIEPVTDRLTDTSFEARCCFYDTKNKCCRIYKARPYVCRQFKCSHKDWKARRDIYEERAYYNSTKSKHGKSVLATFDDLIYDDYTPLLIFISNMIKDRKGRFSYKKFLAVLKDMNRTDILDKVQIKLQDGTTINGKN